MADLDDLLNDINSVPTKEKKKKKKNKKDKEEAPAPIEEKKEEIKEEPKMESFKEEPPKEEEKKEEEKKEDNAKEELDEEPKEEEAKEGEKKKVKKVVKKVKKGTKKGGKDALLIKMLQEKKKQEKELEEKLLKEQEERERKEKEEEEKRIREEEERKKKEEEEKLQEELRLKKLKELGIKASEVAKIEENKKKTEEMLKKQGTSLDEVLASLAQKPQGPRKKKNKPKKEEKTAKEEEENIITNEEENVNKEEDNKEEEKEENNAIEDEDNQKFEVNQDNDDIDDWENEVDDKDQENEKEQEAPKEEEKPDEEEEIETKPEKKPESKPAVVKKVENLFKMDDEEENKTEVKEIKIKDKKKEKKNLRAPIVCILGHVDTGKTKILDKLRHSNVQLGEAGGITQQIGATFLPIETYKQHMKKLDKEFQIEPNIPGILLIDTPGHASFQNLRSRGSGLCDIAVLIINIMKGIEKQTLESLDLLRKRKTPFIIALNQMDRIYNWQSKEWSSFRQSYDSQKKGQQKKFDDLVNNNITELIKNNLNTALYDNNPSMQEYINLVPTSAITGEGMPDLIGLLVYLSQKYLYKKIQFKPEVQCTILEVKVTEGMGTTIDVILVNGTLKVGDKIILGGLFGPIKTTIKIILTPKPLKEMRVKSEYDHHEKISGSIGVKLFCPGLEDALAGSPIYVYETEEEAEKYGREITRDFNSIVKDFLAKSGKGIMVQASTLGSLEAILTYLNEQKIEVSAVGVGNLNKKDVVKMQTIKEKIENPVKEDMVILSFDNKVLPEAQLYADANGIKIFNDDIIYHLFDSYIDYKKQCAIERKKEKEKEAIFPCFLKIVCFINKKDPLIIGVNVVEGILKLGTPLYCPEKKIPIGIVEGMEKEHKPINNVKSNDGDVSIRIKVAESNLTAGRHFDEKCTFVSHITRNSIDALKNYFRDEMTNDDWKSIIKLKKLLEVQ